jgi:hypothetical protein
MTAAVTGTPTPLPQDPPRTPVVPEAPDAGRGDPATPGPPAVPPRPPARDAVTEFIREKSRRVGEGGSDLYDEGLVVPQAPSGERIDLPGGETPKGERSWGAMALLGTMVAGGLAKQGLDVGRVAVKYRESVSADPEWRTSKAGDRLAAKDGERLLTPREHRRRNVIRTSDGRSWFRQMVMMAPEASVLDSRRPPPAEGPRVPRTGPLAVAGRVQGAVAHRIPATPGLLGGIRAPLERGAAQLATVVERPPERSFSKVDARLAKVATGLGTGLMFVQAFSAWANVADGLSEHGAAGLVQTKAGRTGSAQTVGTTLFGAGLLLGGWRAGREMKAEKLAARATAAAAPAAGEMLANAATDGVAAKVAAVAPKGGLSGALAGIGKWGGRTLTSPVLGSSIIARGGALVGALTLANEFGAFGFLDRPPGAK